MASCANTPTLWVDADSLPVPAREIILKAARRTGVRTVFVANTLLPIKTLANIEQKLVAQGFDEADNHIASRIRQEDLLITSDIPLAAEVLAKGCQAISSRGQKFSPDSIVQQLAMRDFMDSMRATLQAQSQTRREQRLSGQVSYSAKDKQTFANALNTWLTKLKT